MDGKNENEVIIRRRGRPKKGKGSDMRLEIRIGPDENSAIEHMLVESERTKSEIVRKAIMQYYRTNRGRW
jgi:hypothetical protein